MKNHEITDDARKIWSAIRYLDPDEKSSPGSTAAMIGPLVPQTRSAGLPDTALGSELTKNDEITDDARRIWSAIRYLDPDEKSSPGSTAAMISPLVLALLIALVVISLRLGGL